MNYPLAWQRDGAYVLVALARSGERARLRDLAREFAKTDFFGGFGAEADAPGLSLWALANVSAALADPEFDREIWPDLARKAALIERLRSTTGQVRAPFAGPVVPVYRNGKDLDLVADPARDGLIEGRMDWHRPLFYVNAVSYAGLVGAAEIARRGGHAAEAAAWSAQADALRQDWRRAFGAGERDQLDDDRTAISGLWPSEIADPLAYQRLLDARWRATRTSDGGLRSRPLWTYFTLAEAHQWLRLGRPDRVWPTLRWFWARQPAPGLYTLWEGDREENGFGLWSAERGWMKPPNVTPHYWAAAEMLLLQLEMLAAVEGPPEHAQLVIGAGVPRSWLAHPVSVRNIGTSRGPVDWSWDGRTVIVRSRAREPVRLGPAFPANTPVRVVRG
jgi:hypothetical protein